MEGLLELAGGRRLAYTEWGHPDAPAILYCHGFPTNRLELDLLVPRLESEGIGVRVVALNRPGYGLSTAQQNRRFLDWPGDVAQAADKLGINRFAVIGVSGGSPYALACAYSLGNRVTRLGIVVGLAPLLAPGMLEASAISGPSSIRLIRRFQFAMMAYGFRRGGEDRFLAQTISTMSNADKKALEDPKVQQWFIDMTRESLDQGGDPAAYEADLYRQDWGFDIGEVETETFLWYGGVDQTVPASAGQWLANHIPNSNYHLWPQHGHFTWMLGPEAAAVFGQTAGLK